MKCSEVSAKLPEYLAGTLSEAANEEISAHLTTCPSCRKEEDELSAPLLPHNSSKHIEEGKHVFKRSLRRIRINMMFRIAAVVVAVLFLYYNLLPYMVGNLRSTEINLGTRALALYTQFSCPYTVAGYGNRPDGYYSRLTIYTNKQEGMRRVIGPEITAMMSYITGKMDTPQLPMPNFVHPIVPRAEDDIEDVDNMITTLEMNQDNRGATISVSLNELISVGDVARLLNEYEVKVGWMAIEAGVEERKHPNVNRPYNQIYHWGIPGTLWQIHNGWMDVTTLASDNAIEYEDAVFQAMTWLEKNKYRLGKKDFLGSEPVGNRAAYVLENGIKIYGLELSGTTTELLKLVQTMNLRRGSVEALSFWWPLQ